MCPSSATRWPLAGGVKQRENFNNSSCCQRQQPLREAGAASQARVCLGKGSGLQGRSGRPAAKAGRKSEAAKCHFGSTPAQILLHLSPLLQDRQARLDSGKVPSSLCSLASKGSCKLSYAVTAVQLLKEKRECHEMGRPSCLLCLPRSPSEREMPARAFLSDSFPASPSLLAPGSHLLRRPH